MLLPGVVIRLMVFIVLLACVGNAKEIFTAYVMEYIDNFDCRAGAIPGRPSTTPDNRPDCHKSALRGGPRHLIPAAGSLRQWRRRARGIRGCTDSSDCRRDMSRDRASSGPDSRLNWHIGTASSCE